MRRLFVPAFIACLLLAACDRKVVNQPTPPYLLSSWIENKVSGEVFLVWDDAGQAWLKAVFSPEEGCHLYSKDLPLEGVDGLGRPTLIEVVPGGSLVAAGDISNSVAPIPDTDIPELFIYPVGKVVLTLPIALPQGDGWYDEQVSITYMACKDGRCYPPVEAKSIPVRVPGIEEIDG